MIDPELAFADFQLDNHGYFWVGEPTYQCWGGQTLTTYLEVYDQPRPTAGQLGVLSALLNQPRDIRRAFEKALFKEYQDHIYGSVSECGRDDQWEELTPTLQTADQIWSLLAEPEIRIAHLSEEEAKSLPFRVSFFDCRWDEEHGFGVEIRNWKIKSFGGEIA